MKLAGIQKHTLVDYPGKVACIVFTQGCNFRCHFCHNPECVLPEKMMLFANDLIPEENFFAFLESRKGFLDGVSICGGEPTLQSDPAEDGTGLYAFAKRVKAMGFAVKLDTNGRDWQIVKRMVNDGILDYVAVDLKHALPSYYKAVGVEQSEEFYHNYEKLLQFLLEGNVDYEYRSTIAKGLHTAEDIEAMAYYIRGAKNFYLQNYVGGNTLDPDFGGAPFDEDELLEFQKIAKKYVKHVEIRN